MQESKEETQLKKVLDGTGVIDFMQYLQSPWRIFWTNFLAGISRGFGIVLGMSVVLGIAIWILAQMVNVPLVGEYFGKAQEYINHYVEQTNYSSEFNAINQNLEKIHNSLQGL